MFIKKKSIQEAPAQNKKPVVAKNGSVPTAKTIKSESSSDSSDDSSDNNVSFEANAVQNARIPKYSLNFYLCCQILA